MRKEKMANETYKTLCKELGISKDESINFNFSKNKYTELSFCDGQCYNVFRIDFNSNLGRTLTFFQKCMNMKKFIYNSTECLVSTSNLSSYNFKDEQVILRLRTIEQLLKAVTSSKHLETYGLFYNKVLYKTTIGLDEVYYEKTDEVSFTTRKIRNDLDELLLTNTVCCLLKRELYEKMYNEKVEIYTEQNKEAYLDINYINSVILYLAVYKIAKQKGVTVLDYLLEKLMSNDRSGFFDDIDEMYGLDEENLLEIFRRNLEYQLDYFYLDREKIEKYTKINVTSDINSFLSEILENTSIIEEKEIRKELSEKLRGPFFKYV